MSYLKRALEDKIINSLKFSPCIYINGPRQVGKSTLVKKIAKEHLKAEYITFDDPFIRANAKQDPKGFLDNINGSVVLDEIQMVPELFRLIKIRIDETRNDKNKKKEEKSNSKIILTGSTDILALPKLSDALVGRVAIYTLYPFSSSEVISSKHNFTDYIFNNDLKFQTLKNSSNLVDMIKKTTFPEVYTNLENKNFPINDWFRDYVATILERDVKQISNIHDLDIVPRLLKLLAGRVGGLMNDSKIAGILEIDNNKLKRYRTLLELVFLTFRVKPWFNNLSKRLVKAPKVYFTDTSLLIYLLGTDIEIIKNENPDLFGFVLENFVATELVKQLSSNNDKELYHFKMDRQEVDFLIESRKGEIIGIEVKSKAMLDKKDIKGLQELKEFSPKKFKKGIVLYTGDSIIAMDKDIWAVPVQALWSL